MDKDGPKFEAATQPVEGPRETENSLMMVTCPDCGNEYSQHMATVCPECFSWPRKRVTYDDVTPEEAIAGEDYANAAISAGYDGSIRDAISVTRAVTLAEHRINDPKKTSPPASAPVEGPVSAPIPFEQFKEHYGFNAGSALYTLSKDNAELRERIGRAEAALRKIADKTSPHEGGVNMISKINAIARAALAGEPHDGGQNK